MYFNNQVSSTNIDNKFSSSDKKKSNISNKKIIIIGSIVLVLIIFIILILTGILFNKYYIVLEGDNDIIIYKDSEYLEPGYIAYDSKKRDLTDKVIVSGDINTESTGEYIITYKLNNIKKTRKVSVIENSNQITIIYLKGDKTVYIRTGETYTEPGYIVMDSMEKDLEDSVKITGNVDTNKAGTYKLIYSIVNKSGVTVSTERTIIVMD